MNPYELPNARLGPQQPQPMGMAPPQAPSPGGGQLDPQLMQAMLAMNSQESEQNGIDRQLKMAQMLRGDSSDQMKGKQAGRVYVPPTIANLGADLFSTYKAKQSDDDAALKQRNLNVGTQAALGDYFRTATRQRRPAAGYMGEEGE